MNPHIATPQTKQPTPVSVNAGVQPGEELRPDPSITLAPQPGSPFYTPPRNERTDTSRAAFPRPGFYHSEAPAGVGVDTTNQQGMTLREWFAGMAMPVLLKYGLRNAGSLGNAVEFAVSESFKIADKMIEREPADTPAESSAERPAGSPAEPIDAES